MANIRTLKLNLLGDVSQFRKSMKTAGADTQSFSSTVKGQMKSLAKSAALAGVAVAGMAVAFGVDAVKAAIEDQKSQKLLQKSLANTTKATDKQRKAVEKWITKQQFAYGFSDSKLRPNLAKLARATGSLKKAQDLLSLAMDISAGSGRDLDSVTQALSRAQMGNLTGLKKLGIPLTDAIIKTKDLKAATEMAAKTYGGSASTAAKTFAGKMAIFKQRIDEAKESIGTKLLTVLQPLADKWLPKIAQLVTDTIDGFMGKKGNRSGFSLGKAIRDVAEAVASFIAVFNSDANGKTKTFAENVQSIANALESVAHAINNVTSAIAKAKAWLGGGPVIKTQGQGNVFSRLRDAIGLDPNYGLDPLLHPNDYVKNKDGTHTKKIKRSNFMSRGQSPTIINLNGIVDAESARRSIQKVLNQSSIRTGPVAVNGSLI